MTKQSTILNATQRNATQGLTALFLHTQVNTDTISNSMNGRYCYALIGVAFCVSGRCVLYEANMIPI